LAQAVLARALLSRQRRILNPGMSAWSRCTVDKAGGPSGDETQGPARVLVSAKLLDGNFCSVPQGVPSSLKTLLTDLRDRQEDLFRVVTEQQKEFQGNLVMMHAAIKANTDAQVALKRHQMDFLAEFRKATHNAQGAPLSVHPLGQVAEVEPSTMQRGAASSDASSDEQADSLQDSGTGFGAADSLDSRWKKGGRKSGLNLRNKSKDTIYSKQTFKFTVSRLLKRKEFELAIAFAIMINAFIMCWECQYQGLEVGYQLQYPGRPTHAKVVWPDADVVFNCCDWFFGCLFLLEMLLKLVVWGHKYFYVPTRWDPEWGVTESQGQGWQKAYQRLWMNLQGWNLLDFSCVGAFIFDKAYGMAAGINPQMIRLLRLFRLFRMVRLLRFLESLDHLYIMTTAISGVKHVLVWAIVLLTIMLLTCDLFLVQILHATYFDQANAVEFTPEQLRKHHQMYEYFGTTTRCMLSMFEITLGNWPPVARLLSEEASEWFTLFCLLHKLTIGFAVISVISGVILQETFKVAQTDDIIMFRQKKMASAVLRRKLTALFQELDDSGDGRLEMCEVDRIRELPDVKFWLASLGIETDDVLNLFQLVDADGDGFITLDEMISQMPRLQGAARSIDLMTLKRKVTDLYKTSSLNSSSRAMSPCAPDHRIDIGEGCRQPDLEERDDRLWSK